MRDDMLEHLAIVDSEARGDASILAATHRVLTERLGQLGTDGEDEVLDLVRRTLLRAREAAARVAGPRD